MAFAACSRSAFRRSTSSCGGRICRAEVCGGSAAAVRRRAVRPRGHRPAQIRCGRRRLRPPCGPHGCPAGWLWKLPVPPAMPALPWRPPRPLPRRRPFAAGVARPAPRPARTGCWTACGLGSGGRGCGGRLHPIERRLISVFRRIQVRIRPVGRGGTLVSHVELRFRRLARRPASARLRNLSGFEPTVRGLGSARCHPVSWRNGSKGCSSRRSRHQSWRTPPRCSPHGRRRPWSCGRRPISRRPGPGRCSRARG